MVGFAKCPVIVNAQFFVEQKKEPVEFAESVLMIFRDDSCSEGSELLQNVRIVRAGRGDLRVMEAS